MIKTASTWPIFIFFLIFPISLAGIIVGDYALAAPEPVNPATTETAGMLDQVLADPQKYLHEEIAVAGVLQAAKNRRFFLTGQGGKALEIWPWAPFEIYTPPPSRPGEARPKPMGYFVGRRLLLKGRLQKVGENYIFKVSTAVEL